MRIGREVETVTQSIDRQVRCNPSGYVQVRQGQPGNGLRDSEFVEINLALDRSCRIAGCDGKNGDYTQVSESLTIKNVNVSLGKGLAINPNFVEDSGKIIVRITAPTSDTGAVSFDVQGFQAGKRHIAY